MFQTTDNIVPKMLTLTIGSLNLILVKGLL